MFLFYCCSGSDWPRTGTELKICSDGESNLGAQDEHPLCDLLHRQKFQRYRHHWLVCTSHHLSVQEAKQILFYPFYPNFCTFLLGLFRDLIPRVGIFSACSHLVVDMKNTEATIHFLDKFIGFLPNSGYYYFFLEKPEEASSQQSETLFNHPFFQKV